MTESTLVLAMGCVLQIAEVDLEPLPDGWRESARLELVADPQCPTVSWPMPAHARMLESKGRTRLGDGGGSKLGPERWSATAPELDGTSVVTVHLPELVQGDRVVLQVARFLPAGPLAWRPGAARFWRAALGGEGSLRTEGGEASKDADKKRVWASGASPTLLAAVEAPGHSPPAEPEPLAAPDALDVTRRLTLEIPAGDPQVRLYPGGGSSVREERALVFGSMEVPQGWVVPAPPGAELAFDAQPPHIATLVHDAGVPRVRVAPFEGRARVSVAWTEPDAPTFGERQPGEAALHVDAPGGIIERDGPAWRLVAYTGRPVLPDRPRLVKALSARFHARMLPEPGLPAYLRGQPPGWEVAGQLRAALHTRVGVLPQHGGVEPLWPRKLVRARRSGAITPMEATLTLVAWARQLGAEADWVLARPAALGPGSEQSPAGFVHPLLWVRLGEEVRWMDAACGVCAPFELPPEVEGASALGPRVVATPEPSPGSLHATWAEDSVTWRLEGAAALHLRRWLGSLGSERKRALAEHVGGQGAVLRSVAGLDDAGAPVEIVTSRGDAPPDPTAEPEPGTFVPWMGPRTLTGGPTGEVVRREPTARFVAPRATPAPEAP